MFSPRPQRTRYDSMNTQGSENGWPRPASPSFSTTTTNSRVHLPAAHLLISRKDLRQSIACFEELMAAAKAYRNALLAMSQATAAFAQAMEACSRVKGCRSANSALAGASGLQHLLSNHDQLLADTVYRQFEIPLLSALDEYKLTTADRLAGYEKSLSLQSDRIRKTEAENLKVGRRKKRDLNAFRFALQELQRQVDELDAIKAGYHEEVLDAEDEIWDTVLSKVAFVVRSQLDFYEKIAGKVSDPILEPLVQSIPDPFDSYGPPKEDGQIFSVLAPLGMLDSIPQSPSPNLPRSRSSPSHSAHPSSGSTSPSRPVPFPTMTAVTPSKAETSSISALGISSPDDMKDRARRELSVIDERDAGMTGKEDQEADKPFEDNLAKVEQRSREASGLSQVNGDEPNVDNPEESSNEDLLDREVEANGNHLPSFVISESGISESGSDGKAWHERDVSRQSRVTNISDSHL